MMGKVIDCHIHAVDKKDFELYKKHACADFFVNIRSIEVGRLFKPFDFEDFKDCKEMFFLDSLNLDRVEDELLRIELDLQKYERIIGLKIYIGYQSYYANDPKVYKIIFH